MAGVAERILSEECFGGVASSDPTVVRYVDWSCGGGDVRGEVLREELRASLRGWDITISMVCECESRPRLTFSANAVIVRLCGVQVTVVSK